MRNGSASNLQAMLDRATDGAITLDLAGRILSLNEPAERLFGYDQKEIAGESVLMLLAPQSHAEAMERLERLSREDDANSRERAAQVVGRDRAGAPLMLALTLTRIGSGEAPHFAALVRDLGREREAERRLIAARNAAEAASAAKTDFLAQVSHEIRTPLHAILGFAEVMMEERFGPVGNERYKDYLKDIHASGGHVMSLADDLLDLSKIEVGQARARFRLGRRQQRHSRLRFADAAAGGARAGDHAGLALRPPAARDGRRALAEADHAEPHVERGEVQRARRAGDHLHRGRRRGAGGDPGARHRRRHERSEVGLALAPFSRVGRANGKAGAGLGLPLTKALVEANKADSRSRAAASRGR